MANKKIQEKNESEISYLSFYLSFYLSSYLSF